MGEMEKDILTIKELGEYLGMKVSNLYLKVERREIPYFQIGRLLRFRKFDIDTWLDSQKIDPVGATKEAKRVVKMVSNPKNDLKRLVKRISLDMSKELRNNDNEKSRPENQGKEVERV